MKNDYDILVIGTGTAGSTLAHLCRKKGKQVAIVDRRPMGGTCAMRGCQPKKYLVSAAEIAGISEWMRGSGIKAKAEIGWPALIRKKNDFTDPVPENTEKSFRKAGIDLLHGKASFASPDTVMVNDETAVRAGHVVLATGSEPAKLDIPGEKYLATSEDFLDLPSLPERILFIGGGYISLEFAHVARAAGSEVTVLEHGDRILKHFDSELVQRLDRSSRDAGINIVTNFKACAIEKDVSGYKVMGEKECDTSYTADLVVHGAGRTPVIKELDPGRGGIDFSDKGILVNEFLQNTANPQVYAIGDVVADSPMLSTVADMEAEVAAANIIKGNTRQPDYVNVPSVVFSLPALAGIGMTEAKASKSGLAYRVKKGSMAGWPTSLRLGQQHAFYKIILEKSSDRFLGVHILGHNAGEIINVFALAMKSGLGVNDMQHVLWAFPTFTSDLKYMIR